MGGPGRNKDTARRTAVAHLKATQALELRVRGASVRGISEALDVSVRYTKILLARALARVEVPGAPELKKLSLQRLDALRVSLFSRFERATDDSAAATLAHALVRCEERTSRLMGLDTPQAVIVSAALNPQPSDSENATVEMYKKNLSRDELKFLMMLTAKAAGKPTTFAIDTTATPAPSKLSAQPSLVGASDPELEHYPPSPPIADEVIIGPDPIVVPPAPQPRPPQKTLREIALEQERLDPIEAEIAFWEEQIAMLAPEPGPNRTLFETKIRDLRRRRDNPNPEISRS